MSISTNQPLAAFLGEDEATIHRVYSTECQLRLRAQTPFLSGSLTRASLLGHPEAHRVEVLFSTWGMPSLTGQELDKLPSLRAVFYAAGSVRYFAKPFLDKGIRVFSAWQANAVPVAEFAFASILHSLKRVPAHHRALREHGRQAWASGTCAGSYRSVVGLASLGAIARKLLAFLALTELTLLAWDPCLSPEDISALGAHPVDSLTALFEQSDVVSLHIPLLPETRGLLGREHFRAMKQDATLINTARGALLREAELIETLQQRPDLTAVLDVTDPEPPEADSPLFSLPNVFLTPHIAGSTGPEVQRMGDLMAHAFALWLAGQPAPCEVTLPIFHLSA